MPLPKISTPTYELTIPSSERKIKYRPFLVKEEKILIIAMESQDDKQIAQAVKDVLGSCIITKGISVDKLSTFDIEYLFLNIRGKSVGETVEVLVTCPDDNKTKVPVVVNLDEIQVIRSENHSADISLDGNLSMRMKYPSMGEFVKSNFLNIYDLENLKFDKEKLGEYDEMNNESYFTFDGTMSGEAIYTTNRINPTMGADKRAINLIKKFYELKD